MSKDREPPAGVIVASNGAWRDKDTGQFVRGMPATTNAITPENSSDLLRLRKEKQLAGMLEADRRLFDADPEYWGTASIAMFELALEKKGTGSVKAFEAVGRATGNLGTDRAGNDPVPPGGARLELGAGVVEDIFKYIQEYRETSNE
jgi:hypothetical protein